MRFLLILLKKPVTAFMLIISILIIGIQSYMNLQIELLPDQGGQWVTVSVTYPNMSPLLIEEEISQLIENAIGEVRGIRNLYSTSLYGESKINIELDPEIDIKAASIDIRQKIDRIYNQLPREANKPEISRYNPSDIPIFIGILTGSDLNYVRQFAENQIKLKFEKIEGVSNVEVIGGSQKEVEILLDQIKLSAYKVGLRDFFSSIQDTNLNIPVGKIYKKDKESYLSVMAKYQNIEDIRNTKIIIQDGQSLALAKISSIKYGSKDLDAISRENGQEQIAVYVQKNSGANTIEVNNEIMSVIENLKIPKNVQFNVSYNQAEIIEESLHGVKLTGILTIFVTSIIIFIFLQKVLDALIIALSIPLSLLLTFSLMFILDLKINLMTLSGLVLGIGLLVDNSVVVLESIQSDLKQAKELFKVLKKIFIPIAASTLTTIIVFMPLSLSDIQTQKIYGEFSLVIAFSLISSFLISLYITPILAFNLSFLSKKKDRKEDKLMNKIVKKYKKYVIVSIRYKILNAFIFFMLFIIGLIIFLSLNSETIDFIQKPTITGYVYFESGTPLNKANELSKSIEKKINQYPFIKKINVKVEKERADFTIDLNEGGVKQQGGRKIVEILNRDFANFYGKIVIRFYYGESREESHNIEVEFYGDTIKATKKTSSEFAKKLSESNLIETVLLQYKDAQPEKQIILRHDKLAQYNLNAMQVSHEIKTYLSGSVVDKYVLNEKQIDISLQLEQLYREKLEKLPFLLIFSPYGTYVPLHSIASFKDDESETQITRKNKRRMFSLSVSYKKEFELETVALIEEEIKKLSIPEDINVQIDQDFYEKKSSRKKIIIAFIFSFILVFMLLSSLYESYFLPSVIITSIPISLIGVAIYMFLLSLKFNTAIYIGMIILCGIVVNNGIILVDEIRKKRKNCAMIISIVQAVEARVRPVIMTSLTTIFSLIPMALETTSAFWSNLAQVVIIGMLFSSLFIFFIIPIFYIFIETFILKIKKKG